LTITNIIIFAYARRSARRVQPANRDSAKVPILGHRDARLLKHMIFMFSVFFCGWIPIYIIAVIDWDGTAISNALLHGLQILPVVSLFIDVVNLFLYNHDLLIYFTNKWPIGGIIRA
jgi:hypothetical protein